MFLAGHPSQGCFGLQSHCAPCYFFNQASFYPSDFSFIAENRKFRFGLIDYPDPESLKAGVLIASSVVDLSNSVIQVRMANISDKTRTIQEGEVIAACAPVTCVDRKCNSQDLSSEDLVKDLLQNTDLDVKQRCAAEGLIKEFQSLFSRTSEDFGRTRLTKHRIDTGELPPIKQHPRRLPFAKQEEVQKLIKEMKDNDVIEPSSRVPGYLP
ncbi:retrovirus-related Pol polyprotein from transposon 412 [Trichonephila clavipes]|nr:retrovirus-related Pol polyprotein from transposon 412 [Trichonephila clavipes]